MGGRIQWIGACLTSVCAVTELRAALDAPANTGAAKGKGKGKGKGKAAASSDGVVVRMLCIALPPPPMTSTPCADPRVAVRTFVCHPDH